jgi:CrcB protein
MTRLLIIGMGGFIGAVLRYQVSGWVYQFYGTRFPAGTFVVNIIGCFLLAFFATLAEGRFLVSPNIRMFVAIGLLGAFTTFSTFSHETLTLMQDSLYGKAALNVVLSVVLGLFAAWSGVVLAKLV